MLALLGLAACAVAPPLAFTDATVLSPDGQRLLADQTVVIRDGAIAVIGPAAAVEVPDDARAIDATGDLLVPRAGRRARPPRRRRTGARPAGVR